MTCEFKCRIGVTLKGGVSREVVSRLLLAQPIGGRRQARLHDICLDFEHNIEVLGCHGRPCHALREGGQVCGRVLDVEGMEDG